MKGKASCPHLQVEFEGVGVSGYSGEIAIDDIEWSNKCGVEKLCSREEVSCQDPKCIPSFLNCNFYNDCPSGSDEHHCGSSYFYISNVIHFRMLYLVLGF